MKRSVDSALLAVALTLGATGTRAVDIGAIGPTYEISEPHFLQMIEQRLREKERSGELKRLQEQAQQRSVSSVTGVSPSGSNTTRLAGTPSSRETGGSPMSLRGASLQARTTVSQDILPVCTRYW